MVMTCIDMCVVILTMYTTTNEVSEAHIVQRRKLRRRVVDDLSTSPHRMVGLHDTEDVTMEHAHVKQIFDLVAWHIGDLNAKWYVKPRSTCRFNEYLFNIYTPDMFYDIL